MSNDYERACDWCSNAAEFANSLGQAACEPHRALMDEGGVRQVVDASLPGAQESELAVVRAPRKTRDFNLVLLDKDTGEKLETFFLRAPADGSLAVMGEKEAHTFCKDICDTMSRWLVKRRKAERQHGLA